MLRSRTAGLFLLVLCVTTTYAQYQGQSGCRTPDGVSGNCIGIRQCPALLSVLQSPPLTPAAVDFLRQSQCGFNGRDPLVCCPMRNSEVNTRPGGDQIDQGTTAPTTGGTSGELNRQPDGSIRVDLSANPLLPSECGADLSRKIVGGQRTDLDEFPWMVLLEYQKPNGRTTACGGVLISKRYILTAAHCIKGKDLPKTWRLASVRLGEYNTDTEHDCVQDDEESFICADDPISVGIEEEIPHENYRPLDRDQKYDIALLRLVRDVQFTSYIKPICLPPNESFGQKLFVAGWGKTETTSASNVKLKLSVPLADANACSATYNSAGVRLGYGQICAGGRRGEDSCRGDSGGPLMALERTDQGNGKWTSVGIVSFGPSPCGTPGWPGVYTRVIDFVPWILGKMRP